MTASLVHPPADPVGAAHDPVDDATAALRRGRPVLLIGRDTCSVVVAAAIADAATVAWTVRHSSGHLTVALQAARATELGLPLLSASEPDRPRHTVAVDATAGITTGISAADRARTARVLADPASSAADLRRPGHVVPTITAAGGAVERPAAAEAAVDLCRLAGLPAVGLVAALEPDDGSGRDAGPDDALHLGARDGVVVLTVDDVVSHRWRSGDALRTRVTRGPLVDLPTDHGRFRAVGYRDELTGAEHLAVLGSTEPSGAGLARVHTECALGVLGGRSCTCRERLDADLADLARRGGVLVYLRRADPRLGLLDPARCRSVDPLDEVAAAAVLADLGHPASDRQVGAA